MNADDLHCITLRPDGPDLDDLVRLIRYLRRHNVTMPRSAFGTQARVAWSTPTTRWEVAEGAPEAEAFFVGPDGAVYDANGEPL